MILNRVKQFRTQHGMTQEDVAAAVRVSRQTIIAIEKGNYTPSLLLAMELAELFRTDVEKLFSLKA